MGLRGAALGARGLAAACQRQLRRCGGSAALRRTPLFDFHQSKGCKFVDFCGWEMPVQYNSAGVLKEHHHCRSSAALFDVSHMGQWIVRGKDRLAFIERLTVFDSQQVKEGTGALTLITNERGGIIDDTVVCVLPDHVYMVVNAGCQEKDLAHARTLLQGDVDIQPISSETALLALQGPKAAEVLTKHYGASVDTMAFMEQREMRLGEWACRVTRCGYTGEDGFEISLPAAQVASFAADLSGRQEVLCAGLAARDSLRLEAGLCLYGNDMNEDTTPVEAGLAWCISKRRREEGGFVGAEPILRHLNAKPSEEGAFKRKRVGMIVSGPPARPGARILDESGAEVGSICSGCPSPTLKKNIAMAYVDRRLQKAGTKLQAEVRGKTNPAEVVKTPFVPHRYFRL